MIVLKASEDQVLGALQAVSGLVERRHTLPIFNILKRHYEQPVGDIASLILPFSTVHLALLDMVFFDAPRSRARLKQGPIGTRGGFFSACKVNARNAP